MGIPRASLENPLSAIGRCRQAPRQATQGSELSCRIRLRLLKHPLIFRHAPHAGWERNSSEHSKTRFSVNVKSIFACRVGGMDRLEFFFEKFPVYGAPLFAASCYVGHCLQHPLGSKQHPLTEVRLPGKLEQAESIHLKPRHAAPQNTNTTAWRRATSPHGRTAPASKRAAEPFCRERYSPTSPWRYTRRSAPRQRSPSPPPARSPSPG